MVFGLCMQVHRFLQITSGKFSGFGTEPCLGEFGEWVAVVIGLHLSLGQREDIGIPAYTFCHKACNSAPQCDHVILRGQVDIFDGSLTVRVRLAMGIGVPKGIEWFGIDRVSHTDMPICSPPRNEQCRCARSVVFIRFIRYSVMTVQPSGIPLTPLKSQVASLLLTNVPVGETPESQFFVVSSEGSSVNKALI